MVWWPPELNWQFLAMLFAGMRISTNPNLAVALLWGVALLVSIAGFWPRRGDYRSGLWLPVLGVIALAGFFALPFSIQTDARYSFFNTRLATIAQFLLVLVLATLPLVSFAGRALAAVGLALTLLSVQLHYRVAGEIDEIVPVFDDMRTGARLLPLIRGAPSAYLDRRFYGQFHYGTVYYYPVLRQGGTVPGLFNNSLMPVGFKPGREPPGVSMRQLSRLGEYLDQYDYIITRNLPPQLLSQMDWQLSKRLESGPWRLYEVAPGGVNR